MAYNVKFSKGSLANYKALNKDASTIYFITDTGALYLGETLIADATDLTDIEEAIGTLTSLSTDVKSDLVSAINEVLGKVNDATEADAVTLTVADTATDGYLKTYVLTQGTEEIGKIDIPKDLVVTSGEVVVNPDGQAEGTYIKLVIANQEAPLYINVKTLVDVYTSQKNATQIQLAVSDTNEISATIVAGSVGTTEIADKAITLAKLSEELQTAISNANSAVQKIETGSTNGTISVDGTDVGVKGLGSAAYENKDAFDEAGAASAVLGTDDDDADTVTVKGNREAITALQTAIGEGGSVATQITEAIEELDATVSQAAGDDGVSATVVETDGKLTSVSVAIKANTYDTYGAASAAESNAKEYADGLASNYDASGSASTAETNAKAYTDTAIKALDAEVSTAETSAVKVTVTEVDGVLTAVTASIAVETYDTYGAASTALTNAKSYTDSELSTALTWSTF